MNVATLIVASATVEIQPVRAGTNATERNNGRRCGLRKFRRYVHPFVRVGCLTPSRPVSHRIVSWANRERVYAEALIHARHFARGVYFKVGPGSKIPPLPEHPVRPSLPFPLFLSLAPLNVHLCLLAPSRRLSAISVSLKRSLSLSRPCLPTASRSFLSVRLLAHPCVFLSVSLSLSLRRACFPPSYAGITRAR